MGEPGSSELWRLYRPCRGLCCHPGRSRELFDLRSLPKAWVGLWNFPGFSYRYLVATLLWFELVCHRGEG